WMLTILVFILLAGVWLVRITARMFWSNHHLANDANHRVVVGRSFLALIKRDVGLSEDERLIIFRTLFRPTKDGIIKDDGYPNPMAGFIDGTSGSSKSS